MVVSRAADRYHCWACAMPSDLIDAIDNILAACNLCQFVHNQAFHTQSRYITPTQSWMAAEVADDDMAVDIMVVVEAVGTVMVDDGVVAEGGIGIIPIITDPAVLAMAVVVVEVDAAIGLEVPTHFRTNRPIWFGKSIQL